MALRKDVKNPFPPESDEVTIAKGTRRKRSKTNKERREEGEKPKDLAIDFDGIETRVAKVPSKADNYGGLAANSGYLIYSVGPPFYYGRRPTPRAPSASTRSKTEKKPR